ncbi:MAG: DUF5667 domain-containing protein [Dehalococcoidia bacterium]|jgi:hypothetical protein
MKNQEFDNILNECLERITLGGETLEQCLERYPEQAEELKPLLETVLAVKKASVVEPRPDFKAKARYQFRSALQEKAAPQRRPFFGWLPRWATALSIVLIVLLAGGGTVAAAANSMPDSILYPVKLATENVRMAFTPSQMGKARLCSDFADERVVEIIYMAEKGDAEGVEATTERLDDRLETLAVLASGLETVEKDGDAMLSVTPGEEAAPAPAEPTAPTEGTDESPQEPEEPAAVEGGNGLWGGRGQAQSEADLMVDVFNSAANNTAVMRAMLDDVPESVRDALLEAIEVSENGYEEVLRALD